MAGGGLSGLPNRRAIALPADVTWSDELAEAVAAVERGLGPLRLAVNAAGIANAAPAEDMPLEQWNKVIDVNLTGVFLSCQAGARAMLRGGGGHGVVRPRNPGEQRQPRLHRHARRGVPAE
ncbi:SDR family NAD(P)-dependent oxidoreductase [Streptomyces sp. LZ34]